MQLRNLTKTPYRDLEYYDYPYYYMSCLQGDNGKIKNENEMKNIKPKLEKKSPINKLSSKNIRRFRPSNKNYKERNRIQSKEKEFAETCYGFYDLVSKMNEYFKNEESPSKIFLNSSLFASKIQSELDQKETEKESIVNFEEKNKTNNGFKSFFSKYKKEDNSFEEDRRVSLQNKGKSLYRFKDEFKNQKNMNKLDFFLNNENEKTHDLVNNSFASSNNMEPKTNPSNNLSQKAIKSDNDLQLNNFFTNMQKFQSNLLKTSESDAAFHQILKTSCLLTELQGKKSQNLNVNQQNLAASNLEFLLNIFANTNIFPDILKLESLNNNFYMNPLKMLSFLAENQKEISSTLYNTVMSKKSDNNFTLNKENNINPNFLNNNYRNSTLDRNYSKKLTPFGRAGIHAAIAYYIYVNKNKDKDFRNVDPTSAARALREKKFKFMDLAQKEKYEEEKKNNYQQILQEFQSKENSETILKTEIPFKNNGNLTFETKNNKKTKNFNHKNKVRKFLSRKKKIKNLLKERNITKIN